MAWTRLSAGTDGAWPARSGHGFASAGGRLYVHGGCNWMSICEQIVWLTPTQANRHGSNRTMNARI